MKLSVLTINIAGFQFDWFEGRREALIRELKDLNPDIIFLQEAIASPERDYDQTLDLANATGLVNSCFTPYGNEAEYESVRLGGISILSRWPFTLVQNRKLPPGVIDPYGARSGLYAVIQNELLLANTHLSYRKDEEELRLDQVNEFLKGIEHFHLEHVIAGGDFNAEEETSPVLKMKSNFYDSGAKGNTFKTRKIDYLFSSSSLHIQSSKVVPISSDHSGVLTIYDY